MKIAVIGLGIIGGSFCKAIKKHTDRLCATARLMKSEAPRRSRKPI